MKFMCWTISKQEISITFYSLVIILPRAITSYFIWNDGKLERINRMWKHITNVWDLSQHMMSVTPSQCGCAFVSCTIFCPIPRAQTNPNQSREKNERRKKHTNTEAESNVNDSKSSKHMQWHLVIRMLKR